MWRALLTIVLAAALGSLAATIIFCLPGEGTGSSDPVRFVLSLAGGSMLFTIPGAGMLYALRASLREREFPDLAASALIVIAGSVAGGLVLGVLPGRLIWLAIGALYGGVTAVALLLVQAVAGLSRGATR